SQQRPKPPPQADGKRLTRTVTGASYGRPYPPVGGADALPPPNPEAPATHAAEPAEESAPAGGQTIQSQETHMPYEPHPPSMPLPAGPVPADPGPAVPGPAVSLPAGPTGPRPAPAPAR